MVLRLFGHVQVCLLGLVLLLACYGCASTADGDPGESTLDVQLEQLPTSEFMLQRKGAQSIAYQMIMRNNAAEPIIITEVQMQTSGRSPYVLREAPARFEESVGPGAEQMIAFSMWAYPRGGRSSVAERVWVRGTISFRRGDALIRQSFAATFREPD